MRASFFVYPPLMRLRLTDQRPKLLAVRQAASGQPEGFVWDIVAVASGYSANYLEGTGLRMYHDSADLRAAVSLFEGRPVYALKFLSEQYTPASKQSGKFSHTPADVREILGDRGLIRNVAGYLKNCRFGKSEDGTEGILAELHLLPSSAELANKLAELWKEGVSDFVGFSYDAYTVPEFAEIEGEPACKLKLSAVNSLDVVTTPAAGGRLLRAVAEIESTQQRSPGNMNPKLRSLLASFAYKNAPTKAPEAAITRLLQSADETETRQAAAEVLSAVGTELRAAQGTEEALASIEQIAQMIQAGDAEGALAGLKALESKLAAPPPAEQAANEAAALAAKQAKDAADAAALQAQQAAAAGTATADARLAAIEAQQAALADSQNAVTIEAEIGRAALPQPSKTRLIQELKATHAGGKPLDRARITQAIEAEQGYISALAEQARNGVPLSTHSLQTRDTRRDAVLALQGLVSERDFTNERNEVIPAFTSFRECYRAFMGRDCESVLDLPDAFLGDENSRRFNSRRMRFNSLGGRGLSLKNTELQRFRALQEITTSDLASIFANVLHNALLVSYGEADELEDWRKVTKKVNLSDLFPSKFSRRSKGRGAVPAVNEGGTYGELSDPIDEDIDLTAGKFGGLAVITHEAIMKDRLDKVQSISSELAYSIKLDIYREVFDYFVNNAAIYDGVTLIHAGSHANGAASGGTALTPTAADACRLSMMDQTAYGDSRDVLGMRNLPKYYLVPSELEKMAKTLTESDRLVQAASAAGGYAAGQILPDAGGPNLHKGQSYIVVPYWTDADNWFAVADPAKVPGILVGFLNNDETPELMTEATDSGSDFSQDKKRFKVRQWRDSAVVDYRPFHGQFV